MQSIVAHIVMLNKFRSSSERERERERERESRIEEKLRLER